MYSLAGGEGVGGGARASHCTDHAISHTTLEFKSPKETRFFVSCDRILENIPRLNKAGGLFTKKPGFSTLT
jgi:hypothetical protein